MRKFLWLSFRFTYSIKFWLRRRFTNAGLFVGVILFTTATLGINTRASLNYQLFTLTLGLLLAAILLNLRFQPKVEIRRHLPRFTTVDELIHYQVEIKNCSTKPLRGLFFLEQLPDPRPSFHSFMNTQEPWDASSNPFDRFFTFPRWQWLTAKNRMAFVREHKVPDLAAGESFELEVELKPRRRGNIELNHCLIIKPDPLGLSKASKKVKFKQSLLVLPKRYKVPKLSLPGQRRYQSGGISLAGSVGEAEEFISLRDFRPGDSLRHIHWKAWARTGNPIVKQYQQEYFTRHALVLDTFSKSHFDTSFEQAVSVAASFVCTIQTQDSLLDLMFVGDQAHRFTAGQGLLQSERMLEILASVTTCNDKEFDYLSHQVMLYSQQISACVCVFLDWDKQRRSLVEKLTALGITPQVLIIHDPQQKLSTAPSSKDNIKVLDIDKVENGLIKL